MNTQNGEFSWWGNWAARGNRVVLNFTKVPALQIHGALSARLGFHHGVLEFFRYNVFFRYSNISTPHVLR